MRSGPPWPDRLRLWSHSGFITSCTNFAPEPLFHAYSQTPLLRTPLEGRSLLPHLLGRPSHDEVVAEYLAEGAIGPIVMIRRGRHKFIHSLTEPDMLFDLVADPDEMRNLAEDPAAGGVLEQMRREAAERWDLPALREEVLQSQRRRRFVDKALATGVRTPWDYQPVSNASRQYVRSHMDLDDLEAMARFPRPGRD